MPTFPTTPGYIAPITKDENDEDLMEDDSTTANTTPTTPTRTGDAMTTEPTFPNIVILKQTEHNYIVKHNHYPLHKTDGNVADDLVSPNQIHKGQLNKKRGRKPKAGMILNSKNGIYDTTEVPNIILHLKCHMSDLKTNESISNYDYIPSVHDVESYTAHSVYLPSSDISNKLCYDNNEYDDIDNDNNMDNHGDSVSLLDHSSALISTLPNSGIGTVINGANENGVATTILPVKKPTSVSTGVSIETAPIQILNERNQREIMKKINRLKYAFHKGETIQTKSNHKSACFWDTCEFDGPVYYIPIMVVNGVFQVNGCYCSPQCATAALLKEPLDTSTKFERLHLLQVLYGEPNGSGKGIKPAPNPHYLLDKYYGNLTISEYRTLIKGTTMVHIVNKPLTHILPELYEDNNDFMVNSKVIPTNALKVKKKYKTMVVQGGVD
jgi:hypothetical protein